MKNKKKSFTVPRFTHESESIVNMNLSNKNFKSPLRCEQPTLSSTEVGEPLHISLMSQFRSLVHVPLQKVLH